MSDAEAQREADGLRRENERLREENIRRGLAAERDVCSGCMQREQQRDAAWETSRQNGVKYEQTKQAWYREKERAEQAEAAVEKVRELLFAFADWPDRDATDFLFRLGRHEMVYRIVAYAFPDELDKVELKPALDTPGISGGES